MTVLARTLGHCTGHDVYTHDCTSCRATEISLARATGTRTADVMAHQLQGAVSDLAEANARIETLLAAENEAWRDAQAWKERAVELEWGQSVEESMAGEPCPCTRFACARCDSLPSAWACGGHVAITTPPAEFIYTDDPAGALPRTLAPNANEETR